MKLVVLVPLLPYMYIYLLECKSPMFRALTYDVQRMVQYAKHVLNSCMAICGTCARPLQQEGLGPFYPDTPREKCK